MQSKWYRIRELLRGCTTLVLATTDERLIAHSTPLFFVMDDAALIYWFSSRRSLHSRHLAANPAASLAAFQPTDSWNEIRGVQMRGMVSMVTDYDRRQAVARRYCERFALAGLFAATIRRSALYCFTPSWTRLIDNSVRFGYKFEVDLARAKPEG